METNLIVGVVVLSVIIATIVTIIEYQRNKNDENEEYEEPRNQEYNINYYPYHKKYLLTKNEYYFYRKLKPIADKYNLQILTKIRLADLIEVNQGLPPREWGKYFAKIKAKHVDFAIADDMKIVLIVELDDRTHQRQDRIMRDLFVDDALKLSGYYIVHTYGNTQMIDNALNNYRTACTQYN